MRRPTIPPQAAPLALAALLATVGLLLLRGPAAPPPPAPPPLAARTAPTDVSPPPAGSTPAASTPPPTVPASPTSSHFMSSAPTTVTGDPELDPPGQPAASTGIPALPPATAEQHQAVLAAETFLRAFARPSPTADVRLWWAHVGSLMTPHARLDYEGIDPASIPYTQLTGPGSNPSPSRTRQQPPTDHGADPDRCRRLPSGAAAPAGRLARHPSHRATIVKKTIAAVVAVVVSATGMGWLALATLFTSLSNQAAVAAANPCQQPLGGVIVAGDGTVRLPLVGPFTVTSEYGMRLHPIYGTWKLHSGIDLASTIPSPTVVAALDGVVASTPTDSGGGNMIILDHGGGTQTEYLHLASRLVQPGQRVAAGQPIGIEGTTGFLHRHPPALQRSRQRGLRQSARLAHRPPGDSAPTGRLRAPARPPARPGAAPTSLSIGA